MIPRSRHAALIWLCLLIYAIGGTLRTAGLLLCVGEGRVRFTFVGDAGSCACCAPGEDDDGCCADADGKAPKVRAPADCNCIDIPLLCGRNDHQPQHPGVGGKTKLPCTPVAWVAREAVVTVPAATPCAAAAHSRAPPWSPQAPPRLRRTVLLLI